MKTVSKLLALLFVAGILQSCDKIEPPYKNDVVINPGPTTERKVLVEDYTGHKCGNCPRASKSLYNLKAVYGDKLIILAIHAGNFATVFPAGAPYYTYDFRTPEGDQLDTDFGISLAGNPNGMVNRRQVNGSYILSSTSWGSEIANVLGNTDPVPVKLTIDNTYDSNTRELQTTVTTEFISSLTDVYKLCVFMVEDSIINWQKDYDVTPNDIPDYIHREALRGSMNGTYGDQITAPTTAGTVKTNNYTYTLSQDWDDTHMSVIAFLYHDATKEIIQVEQAHVE